ncbi:hypothetical protein ACF0H5_006010 [Mactra antiquata]
MSLKKRLLSAYNLEKRAPIQWGIIHEQNGIEEYSKKGGVTVMETGKIKSNVHAICYNILGNARDAYYVQPSYLNFMESWKIKKVVFGLIVQHG